MRFPNWKYPEFDERGMTKWNWMCLHHENLTLGYGVDIGAFSLLNAKYGISIGKHAQLGGGVRLYTDDTIGNTKGKIWLGDYCGIGANAVVMPNVSVGYHSIVGACSYVPAGMVIPDNEIWAGMPVRKIGKVDNSGLRLTYINESS